MLKEYILNLDTLLVKIKSNIVLINTNLDETSIVAKIQVYEQQIHQVNFWQNVELATLVMKEYNEQKNSLHLLYSINTTFKDLQELIVMAKKEQDEALLKQCFLELKQLNLVVQEQLIKFLFTNPYDKLGCYLEITTGMGGLDAQDFSLMLLRMYTRWGENMKFKVQLIARHSLDNIGIKSAIIKIEGLYAYGYLKGEKGVHRLVRISPFNSEGKRQTSFSAIDIYPILANEIAIEVELKDLKIDTYKSSGAGGQHVNTTDSAVRITHIPTGMVVQSQSQRSQHKNKEIAMSMLNAKLLAQKLAQQELEKKNTYKEKNAIDFGSQIRSYILHPYSMVKDHRTQQDYHNTKDILDGNLSQIIYRGLLYK